MIEQIDKRILFISLQSPLHASATEVLKDIPQLDVDRVETLKDGISQCAEYGYDLILAEASLLGDHAEDFIDELKELELNRHCPVLALIDQENLHHIDSLLTVGISDCLESPWSPVVFKARLSNLISNYHFIKAHQSNKTHMRYILSDIEEMICRFTPEGIITFVNPSFCAFFDSSEEALIGSSYFDLMPLESHEHLRRDFSQFSPVYDVNTQQREVLTPDGGSTIIRWTDRAIFDQNETLQGFQSIGADFMEPEEMRQALQHTRRLLHEAQCVANLAGWELDAQSGQFNWTEHIYHMLEIEPTHHLTLDDLQDYIPEPDFGRLRRGIDHALREGNPFDIEFRAILSSQREVWLRALGQPELIDGYIHKIWGAFQDITEQKLNELQREKMRERLEYDATHDQLTDLYNRRFLLEQIEKQYELAIRHKHPMTLAICDVDHFSQVNEKYGHTAGDQVLRHVAKVLKVSSRSCDYVARYAGEQFAMLFPMTGTGGSAICIKRAMESLRTMPIMTSYGGEVHVTVTVGVAGLDPEVDHTPDHMIRRTEYALNQGKSSGRDRFVIATDHSMQSMDKPKRLDYRMD